MTMRLEHGLAPIVVLLDYAALSWFPKLATLTGHPEIAFRAGTVVFLVVNAGVLLRGHREAPAWMTRIAAAMGRRPGPRAAARWTVFVVLAALAVGYRLSAIARTPLDPRQADMLPLIAAASRTLLAGGNPYRLTDASPLQLSSDQWVAYVPPWPPALWLPCVPAAWAGIDLRLVGLLAALSTAVLLGVARWTGPARRDPSVEPARRDPSIDEPLTAWLRLVTAGGLLLAPAAVWFGAIGHTQTYWFYLTGLLWALSRRWWTLAGVGLGLCLMSRHTVLPLLPVLALYAWRCLRPREWRPIAIGAAAVTVALALPFGWPGLWQFVIGSPRWYMQFGDQGWNGPRWWVTHTFGLSSFLYPLGLSRAIPWVGAALLAAVYGLAHRRVRDLASCVRALALVLLAVQVSVPSPFRYEFFPILLVLTALPLLARSRRDGAAVAT